MQFNFAHDFDIDPKSYWKLFLSDEFNEDLFRELKMKNRVVVSQTDDGKTFRRVQKMEPSTQIPGFLQSMIKETAYTEIDTLEWDKSAMKIVIETGMFKDRFQMSGLYVVSPLGAGQRCRREFQGEVKVSMALVGGKIEKFLMEQLRDSYDIAARVTKKWIEKQKSA